MNFSDSYRRTSPFPGPRDGIDEAAGTSTRRSPDSTAGTSARKPDDYDFGKAFAVGNGGPGEAPYYGAADDDYTAFQERLRKGKVKLCAGCGGMMRRSSRMLLSPAAGAALVAFGASCLTFYGLAVNFLQPPWYLKYLLPATYYMGAIFVAVGALFFFLRERVWRCEKCRGMEKR